MLAYDEYRIQFLEVLRIASKPIPTRKVRRAVRRHIIISFTLERELIMWMIDQGWVKRAPGDGWPVFITHEGRAALSKMKKIF
jgi:hypothetical protein